ncbi:MAG: CDP-alcohol phosphatidyltransferase family protein [Chloroflexota bacterium]
MQNQRTLIQLRYRWGIFALLYSLSLGLGYFWLSHVWAWPLAWRWTALAAAVLIYALAVFWRGLKDNHRQDESTLLPTLGAGNTLTVGRGLALGLLAGFLFLPRPIAGLLAWMPAILYTVLSILDYLDGYAARLANHATRLGEALDSAFDALGLLVAVGLAVWYGQLPAWYMLIGLSRYLFVAGRWQRQRQGRPVYDLPPSSNRRLLAGFQMGFITVILWPLFSPPGTTLAGIVFGASLLASFLRDWLVVSGRLDAASAAYRLWRERLHRLVAGWLPALLRLGVAGVSVGFLWPIVAGAGSRRALLAWPGSPWPHLSADALGLLAVLATVMLALGVLGRLASLGLLAPAAMTVVSAGLHLDNGLLLAGTMALMLLGSGYFSLWQPEEALIRRRAGEKTVAGQW